MSFSIARSMDVRIAYRSMGASHRYVARLSRADGNGGFASCSPKGGLMASSKRGAAEAAREPQKGVEAIPEPQEGAAEPWAEEAVSTTVEEASPEGSSTPGPVELDWTILILWQLNPSAGGALVRPVVQGVIQRLGGFSCEPSPGSRIDVWLDSPGGDAHAAYKLGLYLRSHFETVNFVVIDYAKSAATLLALAGDTIFMAPAAELGPLDTQESREGELRMRSNLDTANMIENLYWQLVVSSITAGGEILKATALTREQTIQHVLEFSAHFARPLLEQIDLAAVNAASTSLDVAIEYGARLLSYRNGRLGFEVDRDRMAKLVRGYPTHGYVIDRDEAREQLCLPIRNIEQYELLDEVQALYAGAQSQEGNVVQITMASAVRGGGESVDEEADDGSVV